MGDGTVIPKNRVLGIRFKGITDGEITLFIDGEKTQTEELLTDCVGVDLAVNTEKEYRIEVVYKAKTALEKLLAYARRVLIRGIGETIKKEGLLQKLVKAQSVAEYEKIVDETDLVSKTVKACLKEVL